MTEPPLPPNALGDARLLLFGALEATLERVGWGGRASLYPPSAPLTPSGWIDAATLSVQGRGVTATFPLMFAVDGRDADQVKRLDALLAIAWEQIDGLKVPDDAERLTRGSRFDLMTAGPDDIDLGGVATRALSITAQLGIAPRTLCPTALTASDEIGDTAP